MNTWAKKMLFGLVFSTVCKDADVLDMSRPVFTKGVL